MRRMNLTLAAALMTTAAANLQAAGWQVTLAPRQGTGPLPLTPPFVKPENLDNPWKSLFQPDPNAVKLSSQKPRIVCGTVVVEVDGRMDPKFTHEIPKGAPKGTMKVLPPPPCDK